MHTCKPVPALSRRSFIQGALAAACGVMAGIPTACAWANQAPATDPGAQVRVATPSTCGALRVEDARLCDASGNPVQLRGISTHGLAWFPQYVNASCFAQLRSEWGANVVRLALYTAESGGWCTDGDRDQLRSLIDQGVQAATDADLYVIVDWHILSDANPNDHIDDAKTFFDDVTRAYGGQNNVLYEICNEPNGSTTWDDIKTYAEQVIPVIRANAPDAVVIVGTPTWSQRVDQAAADPLTGFDNLMYTLHFYAATHTNDLRATLAGAVAAGLPVFVTEFGICDASGNGAVDTAQADGWIALLDRLGISYVMWNLSNKDESSAVLKSSCEKISGFTTDDLSEAGLWLYDTLTGARTPDDAAQALADAAQQAGSTGAAGSPQDSVPASGPAVPVALDGAIACAASLRSSWEADGKTCLLYDFTVTNNGSGPCSSWAVSVGFSADFEVQDGWNGAFAADGATLHIANADYNGALAAGQSATDVGVIVAGAPGLSIVEG